MTNDFHLHQETLKVLRARGHYAVIGSMSPGHPMHDLMRGFIASASGDDHTPEWCADQMLELHVQYLQGELCPKCGRDAQELPWVCGPTHCGHQSN